MRIMVQCGFCEQKYLDYGVHAVCAYCWDNLLHYLEQQGLTYEQILEIMKARRE